MPPSWGLQRTSSRRDATALARCQFHERGGASPAVRPPPLAPPPSRPRTEAAVPPSRPEGRRTRSAGDGARCRSWAIRSAVVRAPAHASVALQKSLASLFASFSITPRKSTTGIVSSSCLPVRCGGAAWYVPIWCPETCPRKSLRPPLQIRGRRLRCPQTAGGEPHNAAEWTCCSRREVMIGGRGGCGVGESGRVSEWCGSRACAGVVGGRVSRPCRRGRLRWVSQCPGCGRGSHGQQHRPGELRGDRDGSAELHQRGRAV